MSSLFCLPTVPLLLLLLLLLFTLNVLLISKPEVIVVHFFALKVRTDSNLIEANRRRGRR
jgi:hypothetical protein